MATSTTDIVLWVPARTGSIHLLRTVAATVGARSDLSVEQIDDVRLAVTEAASHLLLSHGSGSTICLRLTTTARGIQVRVTLMSEPAGRQERDGDGQGGSTIRSVEGSLAWQIVLALGEDVRPIADAHEVGVTFAKTRHRAEAP